MKKRFLPLAALLLLAPCSVSLAAVWFTDSFDSYTPGNLPGQGGWAGHVDGVRVVTDLAQSGQAAKADYRNWSIGDATHATNSGTGYHYIDLDVAMDSTGPAYGANLGYIKFLSTAGLELTRVYVAQNQLKVLVAPANQIAIQDDCVARAWYHIRLGINLSTSKLDVWVDGLQKVQSADLYKSGTSVGTIIIGQWDGQSTFTTSQMWVDNLVCGTATADLPATKVLSPGGGWESNGVCYPFAFYDSSAGLYRMFYSGSGGAEQNESAWSQWHTGMVTSADSVNWIRRTDAYEPVLYARKFYEGDLVDPDENAAIFDSISAVAPCVMKEGSTYKMWYTGWGGVTESIGGGLENKINQRIGYATSTDCWNWTKYSGAAGANSVLGLGTTGQPDCKGASNPHVLRIGSTYRMWYDGFDGTTYRILYATSPDGIIWTKQGVALSPGTAGSLDALGCRNPVVIQRGGQYELWYQGKHAAAPNYGVLRAASPDGLTWTKLPGQVNLIPDDGLDSDEKIYVDSIIVQPDSSLWVYFAKENTTAEVLTYGTVYRREFSIYRQVMNP